MPITIIQPRILPNRDVRYMMRTLGALTHAGKCGEWDSELVAQLSQFGFTKPTREGYNFPHRYRSSYGFTDDSVPGQSIDTSPACQLIPTFSNR